MRVPITARIVSTVGLLIVASSAHSGEVGGPYANRLSQADVAQIKAVVSKQSGIPHNVKKIEALGPDKVAIQTGGRTGMDSATYYDFNVYKRAAKWAIDSSSIEVSIKNTENHRLSSDAIGR
jgi:hypothetical protein